MNRLAMLILLAGAMTVSACAHQTPPEDAPAIMGSKPNFITAPSDVDFAATAARLEAALAKRNLPIMAKIDHAAGAEKHGLSLAPTTLYIFGNPKIGTPLMQATPAIGADLPMKAHIYQLTDGTVIVAVTDIQQLANQYGLPADGPTTPLIEKVTNALSGILAETTAAP